MPDRTSIDHSWDRNSDRAHLLLAQNRNKMQCDGLRNVWCSHCANNFCLAFRFQYFFPRLPFTPHLTPRLFTNWIDDFIYFVSRHRYNTAYCRVFTERLSSAARVKSRWNGTTVLLARPFHPHTRRMPTLPECNARVYKHSNPRRKCVGWITETKTRDR